MKLKTILSIMLLVFGLQQANANDGNKYLEVHQNSTAQSFELATVKKITFSQGNTIISLDNDVITIPSAEMQKIAFSSIQTSIENLSSQSKELQYVDGMLQIAKAGLLRVYNISGALLSVVKVNGNATVNMNTLPNGLYIVAIGENTIKINKR